MSGPDLAAIDAALALAKLPTARRSPGKKGPTVRGIDFHGGLIDAAVHGRTDKIPLNVPNGSYVLPADIVSALGQGNTKAGAEIIQQIVGGAPYNASTAGSYGSSVLPMHHGSGPPGPHQGPAPAPPKGSFGMSTSVTTPHMAEGGAVQMLPIIAAGGEYVLAPHEVEWLGRDALHAAKKRGEDWPEKSDLERGQKWLDQFVVKTRENLRKTLAKLAPPRKD